METCYRHPDRETGVSCQRCDKYICPDCATPAAVGFLCPDDAGDKVKIHRANFQKSIFESAPVTISLIAINIIVFVLQFLIPDSEYIFFFAPDYVGLGGIQHAIFSGFAHSTTQLTHILFNMYSLFVLGTLLEPLLGKIKFIVLYLLSLLGGCVAVMFFAPGAAVVGASGAIFGLMGAYVVVARARGIDTSQILVLIGINIFLSFLPGISWQAHIGGLITGLVVATAYVLIKPKMYWLLAAILGFIGSLFISMIG